MSNSSVRTALQLVTFCESSVSQEPQYVYTGGSTQTFPLYAVSDVIIRKSKNPDLGYTKSESGRFEFQNQKSYIFMGKTMLFYI